MPTVRERCAQIKATEPAPVVVPAPVVDFDILESQIDSEYVTGACLIAMVDGRLVASLGLRLREPGGFVHSLFVLPEYRGRGIAEELLRLAGAVAADHGKPTLGLSVHQDNAPAQRLYQRLGFRAFSPAGPCSTTWVAVLPLHEEASLRSS